MTFCKKMIRVIYSFLVLSLALCASCKDKPVDKSTSISDSAFRNAVRNGKLEATKYYLDAGYDISRLGGGGENALHEGVLHYDVASLLIERCINVDVQHRYDGSTPLIVSCIASNVEAKTVELLLKHGADPLIKDTHNKSALDYAKENAADSEADNYIYDYDKKLDFIETHLKN